MVAAHLQRHMIKIWNCIQMLGTLVPSSSPVPRLMIPVCLWMILTEGVFVDSSGMDVDLFPDSAVDTKTYGVQKCLYSVSEVEILH